ncbi:DUF4870 domain-containing protein [Mycoplasmatota bacterium]|nr:DUF4870 domain-containing protein [Mycoplasmatota bacterium]
MSQKYEYDEKTKSYIPVDDDKLDNNSNSDDKLIAILIWAANFVIPLIAGIIAYLYYENKNDFLRDTAKESLNYGISLLIYGMISTVFTFILIGFLLYPVVFCYYVAIPIVGLLKASEMNVYKPHFTIRFIK